MKLDSPLSPSSNLPLSLLCCGTAMLSHPFSGFHIPAKTKIKKEPERYAHKNVGHVTFLH